MIFLNALAAEFDCFVNLILERTHGDFRVKESGGADDLFSHERGAGSGGVEVFASALEEIGAFFQGKAVVRPDGGEKLLVSDVAVADFEISGRGAHVKELVGHAHELGEIHRTVVHGAGEAEAVVYEDLFA